eukprot:CCRYP_004505-RA/>CCRYP_004505-RA protein AED:0.12 eAED:0.12 QI:0/0/0/1/1/1/2/0/434
MIMQLFLQSLVHILLSTASARSFRGAASARSLSLFDNDNSRIIGGRETTKGRYTYAVSLQDDVGSICGGSLIAPDVVLSAAHCQGVVSHVVIGRHDLDETNGDVVTVDREISHPAYDADSTNNDFLLLFLDRPTTANVEIVDSAVTVMGWGDTTADDTIATSDVLRFVEVNVMSNADCDASKGTIDGFNDSYNGRITDQMMCAKDIHQDSCQGDSGGPLVILGDEADGGSDVLVGVVSWGIGCANANFPGVYARVSAQYDWIRNEVCKRSTNPPVSFRCEDFNQAIEPQSTLEGWKTIIGEDFKTGYGFFPQSARSVVHYKFAKDRVGVIRMKSDDASFYSSSIGIDSTSIQVSFSVNFPRIAETDYFCLDYSLNDGSSWTEKRCWNVADSFESEVWYSTSEVFESDSAESLMIRFRSSGDWLLDQVEILGTIS